MNSIREIIILFIILIFIINLLYYIEGIKFKQIVSCAHQMIIDY